MSTQTDVEALAKLRDDHQVWLRRAYEQGYDDAIKGVPNDAEIEERTKVRIESARAFDALLARAEPEIRRSHESTPAPAAPDALREALTAIAFIRLNFERAERLEAAIRAHMEKSHRLSGRIVIEHDGIEHAEGDPCDLCAALAPRKEGKG